MLLNFPKEIKEKQLPSLDDDFSKGIGSDSIAALREQITVTLKARAEERARVELEQKAIDAAVAVRMNSPHRMQR